MIKKYNQEKKWNEIYTQRKKIVGKKRAIIDANAIAMAEEAKNFFKKIEFKRAKIND